MPAAARRPYRPEVDGLRAVAVMLVVLFHLGYEWIPGGYIGVDIFFVISGFLITRLILDEVENGSFSFRSFYLRRMRRLAPALLATLLTTCLVAFVLFTPTDFKAYGREMAWSALGLSNFYFAERLDYFDNASSLRPLLHTWSLAVEEQYYLIAPLFIFLIRKRWSRTTVMYATLVTLVLSFAAAVIAVRADPQIGYFWTPFRAWQIALGSMVVFLPRHLHLEGARGDVAAIVGLTAIIASSLLLSEKSGVPGWAALLSCLGTALILSTKSAPLTFRCLSTTPMLALGRASYSLYLVHWPLIVIVSYWFLQPNLPASVRLPTLAASFVLAFGLHHLIEERLRKPAPTNTVFVQSTMAFVVAIAAGGWAMYHSSGLPSRINAPVIAAISPYEPCRGVTICILGDKEKDAPAALFVGDSNARHYAKAIDQWGQSNGQKVIMVASAACNITGDFKIRKHHLANCKKAKAATSKLLNEHENTPLLIAHNWNSYRKQKMTERLIEFIGNVGKRPVTIVGQTPYARKHYHHCGQVQSFQLSLKDCETYKPYKLDQTTTAQLRRELSGVPVRFIDPATALCTAENCSVHGEAGVFFYDKGHLSLQGAKRVLDDRLAAHLLKPEDQPTLSQ
ncbi:acyltransferase family protein [Pseudahrensia aquimaris]|uniref:Acyltransferase family protein n=1 Tax=Pseudahrensia aquimaris TaxID=744461 RepID=A0ABW3FHU0_9HYPH